MSKIDQNLINSLFSKHVGYPFTNVIKGPQYGVDCALIDLAPETGMVLASDPLSFIPSIGIKESAYISIHLAANDIATTSLSPQYGQFVLNLPSSVSSAQLVDYWESISAFSFEIGLNISGGHTGFDAANHSTIAGGVTLIAIGQKRDILLSSEAQEGDVLLMTKSAGIISTSILAMSFPNYIKQQLGENVLEMLQKNIWNISVLPESKIIHRLNKDTRMIHAMHDVTEGGIMGAIYEFACASNLGVQVLSERIHVDEDISRVAHLFGVEATKIIGAGCMLIACKASSKDTVIAQLAKDNIRCTEIGYFCSKKYGMKVSYYDEIKDLEIPKSDPYWDIFDKCIKNGLS